MDTYEKYRKTKYDWLGEIPNHWDLIRTRFIFTEINDRSDEGLETLLSVSQYTGIRPKREGVESENDNLTNASSLKDYKLVVQDDLVMNIMLAWNGSVGISEFDGIVSPAYCVFRIIDEIKYEPKFFHYLFKTEKYKAEFKRSSTGIIDSRLRLYPDKFFSIPSIVPPFEEQKIIVDFIEKKLEQVDLLIKRYEVLFGKIDRKRGLIQEYKRSLIETAILGKINVLKMNSNKEELKIKELLN